MPTLGDRLALRDARAFAGRGAELQVLDELLARDHEAPGVAYVHGDGGVGKSTLLRELARRGAELGRPVLALDGRDLPPLPEALAAGLAPASALQRPLVLLDTHEEIASLDVALRRDVLPSLPAGGLLVIASRLMPDATWLAAGAIRLELGPLDDAEARELLRLRGVPAADARRICGWAGGSPLALVLAAETAEGGGQPGASVLDDARLLGGLVDRLAGSQHRPERRDALYVAAIATVVTPAMLAEVLGTPGPEALYDWLAARAVAAPRREGIALHELARRALRADMAERIPGHDRELCRRVVDHLHVRALAGEAQLSVDLGDVAAHGDVRAGWVPQPGLDAYADVVRPGDAEAIAGRVAARHGAATAAPLQRLLEHEPGCAHVVRDAAGETLAFGVSASAATAGETMRADPVVGPWLEHAEAHGRLDASIFIRDVELLGDDDADSPVQALVNVTAFLGARLPNPRWCYSAAHERSTGQRRFLAALDAEPVPELDAAFGAARFSAFVIDYGAGGFLDFQRRDLYRRLGFGDPYAALPPIDAREVLRGWAQADASSRARVLAAIAAAFGDDAEDARLRRALELAYVDPPPGGSAGAGQALGVGRSHWFRLVAAAVERVDVALASSPG